MIMFKRDLTAVASLCVAWIATPIDVAHANCTAPCTKSQITTDINTNWPDNTVGSITPAALRSTVLDLVNSYLDTNGAAAVTCSTHQFLTAIATLSTYTCAQPAYTDISGSLPNPSASTLGGVESIASLAHNWIASISTSGVPVQSQPACSDLSNAGNGCSAAAGQLPGTTTNDNATAGNIGELISSNCPTAATTVTITIANPAVITWTAHGITSACPVVFTTTGALPTGLTAATVTYYVVPSSITTNTFQVATTVANALAGTSVTTTGTQSGTQTGTEAAVLSSGLPTDVTGISLTAGDWDVWGMLWTVPAGSTTSTLQTAWVSTTSVTEPASPSLASPLTQFWMTSPAGGGVDIPTGIGRVSVSSSTPVYLGTSITFAVSTMKAIGTIWARRRR